MNFTVLHQSTRSRARVGRYRIQIPSRDTNNRYYYEIETPSFIPVATNAALKSMDFVTARKDAECNGFMFCNTYHLLVHKVVDIIDSLGGLQSFVTGSGGDYPNQMQPNADSESLHRSYFPFITDSGGFQAFSLRERSNSITNPDPEQAVHGNRQPDYIGNQSKHLRSSSTPAAIEFAQQNQPDQSASKTRKPMLLKVSDEDGLVFRSYKDGSIINLSPESTVQAQKKIGANIILPLDELLSVDASDDEVKASMERSHRWERRSLDEHLRLERSRDPRKPTQWMFGIVHGGHDLSLRAQSASYIVSCNDFNGVAIGGSVGRKNEQLGSILNAVMPKIPMEMPRHLLGVADISSVLSCIPYGIDTFDSCYPARIARHGVALMPKSEAWTKDIDKGLGIVNCNIRSSILKSDAGPLSESCNCATCRKRIPRAYLHHLYKSSENHVLGLLLTTHNLFQMAQFTKSLRESIMRNEV